jgi:hypothetical protein
MMWSSLHRPSLHHAAIAIALTLLGCAGLAAAAHSEFGHRMMAAADRAEVSAMDETTGSLGYIGAGRAALALSDEDRFHIYEGVMRIPEAPTADDPAAEVADALPGGVPLQDLPMSVVRQIPQVKDYKFVKFDDRILVVNPASRLVVAMIPRYRLLP